MTIKQYLAVPNLKGQAIITEVNYGDRPFVRLNETLFHPQGGGQKADIGTLTGAFGVVQITHVTHAADRQNVDHYFDQASLFTVGEKVELRVDPTWRLQNAQLHTAGHLIAAVVEHNFPTLKAISGHHWPGEARVEFEGIFNASDDDLIALTKIGIQDARHAELAVRICGDPFSTRTIQIGEFKPVPCGGTHLPNVADLPAIVLGNVKNKKGRIRISYHL